MGIPQAITLAFHWNLEVSSHQKNDLGLNWENFETGWTSGICPEINPPLFMEGLASFLFLFLFFTLILIWGLIWESEEQRKKERERNIDVREKHQLVASYMHLTRDQTCSPSMCLDWMQTHNLLEYRRPLQPTEPLVQGKALAAFIIMFSSSSPQRQLILCRYSPLLGAAWNCHVE